MILINPEKVPKHIAIIMDGNGRWAQKHALGRISGHRKGAEAVRRTVKACRELAIDCLTLYAFSSENWLRPDQEVRALMGLLKNFLKSEIPLLGENGISLRVIGEVSRLDKSLRKLLDQAVEATSMNREMILVLALSYGSRDEILEAVKKLSLKVRQEGLRPEEITKEIFEDNLYTAGLPEPDLIIRTSGEYRLSNFLLWQCAYSELYFTDVLWPDFSREDLLEAIADFQKRQRRFGLVNGQEMRD